MRGFMFQRTYTAAIQSVSKRNMCGISRIKKGRPFEKSGKKD